MIRQAIDAMLSGSVQRHDLGQFAELPCKQPRINGEQNEVVDYLVGPVES